MASIVPAVVASASKIAEIVIEEKSRTKNTRQNQNRKKRRPGKKGKQNSARARRRSARNGAKRTTRYGGATVSPQELNMFRKMCDDAIGQLTGDSTKSVFAKTRIAGANVSFEFAHLAQKNVSRSFKNAIRLTITESDGGNPAGTGTGTLLVRGGNSTQTTQPFADDSTGVNSRRIKITPKNMSLIVAQLAAVFEFYAFRYMRFRYKPTVGAYSVANVVNTNVSFAMGVTTDPDSSAYPAGSLTFKGIKELETNASCHVSDCAEMEYAYTGTDVFSNNATDLDDESEQAAIVGAFDTTPTLGPDAGTAGSTYGHIEQFMVLDLYGLRRPDANIPSYKVRQKMAEKAMKRFETYVTVDQDDCFSEEKKSIPGPDPLRSKSLPKVISVVGK